MQPPHPDQSHHRPAMTTLTAPLFDDDLYSVELVAAINQELASDKTALQIWKACTALVHAEEGGWDSAPRDYLLMVMDARETRGFTTLAKRFGYIPQGANVFAVFEALCLEEV